MTVIKGAGGKVLAYMDKRATEIILLAPGGKVLGRYNKLTKQTLTPGGSFVGYGNLLVTLIER